MVKKILMFFVLLAFSYGCAYSYENTYAIIIGIANYKDLSRNDGDLRFPTNDARKFYAFLRSKKGGSVPERNIVMLLDSQATRQNIIEKSKELFSNARFNDRVIFYYSGHGWKECFLPYDITKKGHNMLYFDEVKEIFRCAKCNTKLLFADACFAGSMKESIIKRSEKRKHKTNNVLDTINIAVMMSCKSEETSMEMGSLQQGVFTYYLMEGLGGAANMDSTEYITIQELFYYVHKKVQNKAAKSEHKQTPELFGNFDLRLIVANADSEKNNKTTTIIVVLTSFILIIAIILLSPRFTRKTKNKKI